MRAIGVVTNPNARKNRARPGWTERLERAVGDAGEVVQTRTYEEVLAALERFRDAGVSICVADGGDGALNWLVNGCRRVAARGDAGAPWAPRFVPTNGGTIDFVANKLGVRERAEVLLRRLAQAHREGRVRTVELDSVRLTGWDSGGAVVYDGVGFAAALAGVAQRFFGLYYAYPNPGPATILRIVAAATAGVAGRRVGMCPARAREVADALFEPAKVRVHVDGELLPYEEITALNAGAIDIDLGGVFRVFPLARRRGAMHVQAGALTPAEVIANLPRLAVGAAVRGERFVERTASVLRADALGAPLNPILDGERLPPMAAAQVALGPRVGFALP